MYKKEGIRDDDGRNKKKDEKESPWQREGGRLNDHKHWPIIPNHLPSIKKGE
jgi:hypothetical protein